MVQKFIRGLHNLPADMGGVVATIGTFDGIHLGHQAIMAQVRRKATEYGLPSMAMIFEPHPREFFSQEQAPARLMRMHEKLEAIYAEGIDAIFCLQFNRRLRQLSASDFVQQVLIDGLGVRCLVVGDDFHFGRDREGGSPMLKAAGQVQGFEVIDTATLVRDGRRISSTWVRECLEAGDLAAAQALLGKPFRISGKVMHGQRLGRALGVPTANVFLHRYRAPLSGVFVVEVLLDGQRLPAVANVGVRPTVGDLVKPILEVHLLDWEGELYGRRITVEFIDRLRSERQFAGVDELLRQINSDID
ncbi:MAG: bifunctional riboflavin kinase/FAD synthetase, partial [Bacteroidales bacterium]|nr:bifunctional riboflavin kinase/FAD synthetase [Bacteroidales bacterium]